MENTTFDAFILRTINKSDELTLEQVETKLCDLGRLLQVKKGYRDLLQKYRENFDAGPS